MEQTEVVEGSDLVEIKESGSRDPFGLEVFEGGLGGVGHVPTGI